MGLKPAEAAEKILSHSLSVLKEAKNLVLSSYQNTLVAVLLLQSSDKSNIFLKAVIILIHSIQFPMIIYSAFLKKLNPLFVQSFTSY